MENLHKVWRETFSSICDAVVADCNEVLTFTSIAITRSILTDKMNRRSYKFDSIFGKSQIETFNAVEHIHATG